MLCLVYFMGLCLSWLKYGEYFFFVLVVLFFPHLYVLVKSYKGLLHFLLKWSVYRNLKNGLLIDYFVKYIYIRLFYSIFLVYSIFFNDKFILEVLLFRLSIFSTLLVKYINSFSFFDVLKILKFIFFFLIYISIIFLLIYI
jgi:hypothetical protein